MSKTNKEILFDRLINSSEKVSNYAIFSGNIYTFESALNEMLKLQQNSKLVKWLSPQSAIIYLPMGMAEMHKAISKNPPIFVQHIMPIKHVFDIEDDFTNKITGLCIDLDEEKPFSVQTTIFNKAPNLNAFEINKKISDALEKKGKKLDTKNPYNIISIAIDERHVYMGISTVIENLSKWACGRVYYKKELNRAEYKLIECIEYFKLKLKGSKALDIGAAPGGWTKALSDRGYKIWAVDPADLDEEILENSNVIYMKMTAQKFLKDNNIYFDIIVNDMILDCRESARIMNEASKYLLKDGYGIITAKLPKKDYNKRLKTALKILEAQYQIHGVRQLPSNKSEVTIVVKKATNK